MNEALLKKKYLDFTIVLILAFPILINSVKIFGNLILLILTILGIYSVCFKKKNPFKIPELKLFSWLSIGYFGTILLSMLIADGVDAELHHLGRKLHFLFAPFVALALFQIDLPLKRLLLSIKIGLIIIGTIAITQFLLNLNSDVVLGKVGMMNANIFGDIAVAMLFLSIVHVFIETPRERVITFIAVLAGISAIILSSSRGSWLSFLILSIIYISLVYKPFLQKNRQRSQSLALALLIALGLVITQTNVGDRIEKAVTEIQNWDSGDESNTSNGLRLQMWKAGLSAAKEAPLLGYGYRNANKIASKYASKNKRTISNKTHLHNEYITNLVSAGVIGLLMLLILLFKPMIVFYQQLKNKDAYYYSMMGILLCIGYVTFGFTHVAFGEEHVNAFYVLFMALLLPKVISLKRL
jgi:O-antigen ligase